MTRRRVESVRASQVEREQVRWLVPGRVPFGYVTLLIGEQGLGKSTWLAWLVADHSRNGGVSLMASAEDSWGATLRPRLEACEAALELIHFVEVALPDESKDGLLLPDDVAALEAEIVTTGATLLTVDPVSAHLGREVDSHRDASTRQALAPLARIARDHGCAVVGAHHLNKSASADPLTRASASIAFTGQARSVLLFARDPDDPDGESGQLRALAHAKCNLAPLADTETWIVEPILLHSVDSAPEVATSRVRLTGASAYTGRDLLSFREPDQTENAEQALAALLADGEFHESAEVKRTLVADGHAERTVQRAAQRLGVKVERRGFPSVAWWRHPVAPDPTHESGATGETAQPRAFKDVSQSVAPQVELMAQLHPRRGGATDGAEPTLDEALLDPLLFERYIAPYAQLRKPDLAAVASVEDLSNADAAHEVVS